MRRKLLLPSLLFVVLLAVPAHAATWTLGVWNVENLSPTEKRGFPELMGSNQLAPRSDAQLKEVADHIRDDLHADALMLSEIFPTHVDSGLSRSTPLDKIAAELGPSWKYFLGTTGAKSLAFLFNETRVDPFFVGEFAVEPFTIQGEDIFDRDPLVVWVDLRDAQGNAVFDLLLVGLHLKSGQDNKDNHLVAVAKVVTELSAFKARHNINAAEKDVIILGDLNDSAHSDQGFRYLFDYLDRKHFDHLGPDNSSYPRTRINGSQIDHVFVATSIDDRVTDFTVHNAVPDADQYRETFSDHFPLTFKFTAGGN